MNNSIAPSNTEPYVFYAMDKGNDLKPAGFEFINPLAPGVITRRHLQPLGKPRSQRQDGPRLCRRQSPESGSVFPGKSARHQEHGRVLGSEPRQPQTPTSCSSSMWCIFRCTAGAIRSTARQLVQFYADRARDAAPLMWTRAEPCGWKTPAWERGRVRACRTASIPRRWPSRSSSGWTPLTAPPATSSYVSVLSGHHPLVNYPYQITQQDAYSLGSVRPGKSDVRRFANGTRRAARARWMPQSPAHHQQGV